MVILSNSRLWLYCLNSLAPFSLTFYHLLMVKLDMKILVMIFILDMKIIRHKCPNKFKHLPLNVILSKFHQDFCSSFVFLLCSNPDECYVIMGSLCRSALIEKDT